MGVYGNRDTVSSWPISKIFVGHCPAFSVGAGVARCDQRLGWVPFPCSFRTVRRPPPRLLFLLCLVMQAGLFDSSYW
jgi:hypothetical protein